MPANKTTTRKARRNSVEVKIGDRFGRWTIIDGPIFRPYPLRRSPDFQMPRFRCRCDCGQCREVMFYALNSRHSQSCGCLGREKASARRGQATSHGGTVGGKPIPEYNVWMQMRQRCSNPNTIGWRNYGGRGITVSDEWKADFGRFYADMGPRPSPKHMLERLDNDKGYSKSNCVWATRKQQMMNRRNVVFIEHDGKRLTVADWSRLAGVPHVTIMRRLRKGLPTSIVLSRGWVKNGKVYNGRT